jgi:hypothetical protein
MIWSEMVVVQVYQNTVWNVKGAMQLRQSTQVRLYGGPNGPAGNSGGPPSRSKPLRCIPSKTTFWYKPLCLKATCQVFPWNSDNIDEGETFQNNVKNQSRNARIISDIKYGGLQCRCNETYWKWGRWCLVASSKPHLKLQNNSYSFSYRLQLVHQSKYSSRSDGTRPRFNRWIVGARHVQATNKRAK